MDYPRCKTCRWWVEEDESGIPSDAPAIAPGWGWCQRTDGEHAAGSRALTYVADHFHDGPLWTAPDFGCTQHEPKDDA